MSEEEFKKILAAEWAETWCCLGKWLALSAVVFAIYKAVT